MKFKIFTIILLFPVLSFSQKCDRVRKKERVNKFLDRAFWKEKPSLELVKSMVEDGYSLIEKNRHSMDAVTYAILSKVPNDVVKYMVDTGLNVNELTHDKRTYIFWAAYKDNLDLMKYFMSKGAKTDLIDSTGYSLIQFAAVTGNSNTDIYDYIIKNGGDVKALNKDGKNIALLYASSMKDFKILEYFKSKGVDLNQVDKNGNTLFACACNTKNKKILEGLIARGFNYKTEPNVSQNAFTIATKFSHRGKAKLEISLLTYLEGLGFDPKFRTKKKNTALHNVAFNIKDKEIINFFLSRGLDVNQVNEKGNTAFINSCYMNSKEIVSFFLTKVKDINFRNNDGLSALTIAIKRNAPDVVDYLISKGADVFVKDNKNRDLLYHLVNSFRGSDMKIFKSKLDCLLKNGFKIDVKNNGLLTLAVKKGKISLIKEMIGLGYDINALDSEGMSVLHFAAMTAKEPSIIKKLIKMGADKSLKTETDETVYELALENELLKGNNISFLK